MTLLIAAALTQAPAAYAQIQTYTTIAGGGIDDVVDGADARSVTLGTPWALAVDDNGNVYFTEPGLCVVRKVTPSGIISTVAGIEGVMGFAGSGGPATSATLNNPCGIAVDHAGNLYIADTKNGAIRKVNAAGIISIYKTGLNEPIDIALNEAGDMFVTTAAGNAVYKIAAGGGTMTTLASGFSTTLPSGAYGYTGDLWWYTNCRLNGITLDAAGNVYIADVWQSYIRKLTPAGAMLVGAGHVNPTDVGDYGGDGGPATNAYFYRPRRVAFDPAGHLTIADCYNRKIRQIDDAGKIFTIVNGRGGWGHEGGPAIDADLSAPVGIAYDKNGYLYIADNGLKKILKVSPGTVAVAEATPTRVGIDLLPNPSNGAMTIRGTLADMTTNEATLEVMDMTGAVVMRTTVSSAKGNIDAPISLGSNIANGSYLLRVSAEHSATTLPFVVAR